MPYLGGPARAAKVAALLLLSLAGQSVPMHQSATAHAQPSGAGAQCIVLPNLPLSVGFADRTSMKSLQAQDNVIREVLRGVKSWLCGPAALSPFLFADSLRSAIELHQTLLFDQVRFDTNNPKQAHVLLTDSRVAIGRKHTWKVQVDRAGNVWRVSNASDAPDSLFRE
jgi:hypothetical protein